jgi:hypothetical protein
LDIKNVLVIFAGKRSQVPVIPENSLFCPVFAKMRIYPESDLVFFEQEKQIGFRINFLSREQERARKFMRNDGFWELRYFTILPLTPFKQ